jgi:glycosyltransferase involved in cell wall biosynthesis
MDRPHHNGATEEREVDGRGAGRTLRIAHVLPHVGSAQGGPVLALAALSSCQSRRGHDVSIFASTLEQDGPPVDLTQGVELVQEPASRAFGFRRCPALGERLLGFARHCDVVHSHLLWTDCHRLAARVSRECRVPHVIAPCGTLDRLALEHRAIKKWPIATWFQKRALREAACLNAKSEQELKAFRAYGLTNPIAMIPNPVDYSGASPARSVDSLRRRHGLSRDKSRVLFLGRIHPVKGLERLIQAWAQVGEFHGSWELVVAGPDDDGYRHRIEEQIVESGLQETVRFTGMLDRQYKWAAITDSELLVLPSDFENFGVSAAEAMAAARPIVATTGTPWRRVVDAGAGWWVEKNPAAIAQALREAMSMAPEARREMGRAGVGLVREYTPEAIADAWDEVYAWVRGQGRKPGCIVD